MNKFKVGDWVKHPQFGIGRLKADPQGYEYFIFPQENTRGSVRRIDLKKVFPKFDNFEDLFKDDENE